jgi:UDP-N-acetylmuramate dehydrogenase
MQVQRGRSLSEFSTFGIGGPIEAFAEVKTVADVQSAFSWAKTHNLSVLIVGKGSNCLFSDAHFPGLVLLNKIDHCTIEGSNVTVGAGYSFSLLGVQTARNCLSGLEFASGIPATVGGAVFMNAGANGQETCEVLTAVEYVHADGRVQEFKDMTFGYRTSPFQQMSGCITAARFILSENAGARKQQLDLVERRMKTQPLKDKSAGCVFRNPGPGVSAGALIDQCGLKGFVVGGAKVSEVHANFLVNENGATAHDVLELIARVQETVLQKTGQHLEPEIRIYR